MELPLVPCDTGTPSLPRSPDVEASNPCKDDDDDGGGGGSIRIADTDSRRLMSYGAGELSCDPARLSISRSRIVGDTMADTRPSSDRTADSLRCGGSTGGKVYVSGTA